MIRRFAVADVLFYLEVLTSLFLMPFGIHAPSIGQLDMNGRTWFAQRVR